MPIERIPAAEAFARLKARKESLWPDGRKRGERLKGVAQVAITPGFSFTHDTPVMTIGSCFARNIESHLASLGFDLPMLTVSIPREERSSNTANDILNKYSVHSIENEIRWAFEGIDVPLDKLLLETEDGLWHDPQLAPNLIPASFQRACERREEVMAATRQLSRCGLVIITLGLAESWFDLETGLYLNGALPAASLARHPDRFAVDVLKYSEILESLERIYALIRRHGRPGIKMLITTSPVPFKATFSGEDSLVANCYSKSVQRAACREFSAGKDGVDYFPSYEVVTLTERTIAFEVDNIHVRAPVVERIMASVLEAYCPEAPQAELSPIKDVRPAKELKKEADGNYKQRNYAAAADLYRELFDSHGATFAADRRGMILTNEGVARLRDRQTEAGVAVLLAALEEIPDDARLNYKLGLGYARLKDRHKALGFFKKALLLGPDVPDHAWRYGLELQAEGRVDDARVLLLHALEIDPDYAAAKEALAALDAGGAVAAPADNI